MVRYTKVVLTVIAMALCVLAVQNAMPVRMASAFNDSCGSISSPCHLKLKVSTEKASTLPGLGW